MTSDAENYDRSAKKTQKIVIFIVVPVLVLVAGLVGISSLETEEKPSLTEILSEIDFQCYNVNWFGQHGFQVTYTDTIVEIGETLGSYDIDFRSSEFFQAPEVVDHMVMVCPHIDSRLQLPEFYNSTLGLSALDKCLQVREGFVDSEDYCLQFKR